MEIQDKINTLDRIIGWVENCDLKSTVMAALLGVFFSMLLTSTFITNSLQNLVTPISIYWKTGKGSFDLFCTIKLIFFVGMLASFFTALFYLLKSLTAKTSSTQTGDNNIKTKSLIHYGSIQKGTYDDFKKSILSETKDDKLDDLLSQIYINSKRCQEKFDDYNKSIRFIKIGVVLFILLIMLLVW